jgi:hypothetical protein
MKAIIVGLVLLAAAGMAAGDAYATTRAEGFQLCIPEKASETVKSRKAANECVAGSQIGTVASIQESKEHNELGIGMKALPFAANNPFPVEESKHHGLIAIGQDAMEQYTGAIAKEVEPSKSSLAGETRFFATKAYANNYSNEPPYENGAENNTADLVFDRVPAAVTSPVVGQAYWLYNPKSRTGSEESYELVALYKSREEELKAEAGEANLKKWVKEVGEGKKGGEGTIPSSAHKVEVLGGELKASETRVTLSKSAEDDTVVGERAGERLINGGGNNLFGTEAGRNLKTGEEDVAIGVESLFEDEVGTGNIAIGQEALRSYKGGTDTSIGYRSGLNPEGSWDTIIGYDAGQGAKLTQSTCIGSESCAASTSFGEGDTVVGKQAGDAVGVNDTYLGTNTGQSATGSDNLFIGTAAGKSSTASHTFMLQSEPEAEPLLEGTFPNTQLKINAERVSLYKGVAPVKRAAAIAELNPEKATTKEEAERINTIIKDLKAIGVTE